MEEDKNLLIVMCGLQCSGKSTKAKELAKEYDAVIISSDETRLYHPDWNNEKVFNYIYDFINKVLVNRNVILDATNTSIKSRRMIFEKIKYPCEKVCYIMNTPFEECKNRLVKRNSSEYPNKIPLEVLDKYHKSFEIPFYYEGWDLITLNKEPSYEEARVAVKELLKKVTGFDQHNKYHTKTLDKHLDEVGFYLEEQDCDITLVNAGFFHDIGKVFTQIYKEGDTNAHYYGHANVGAYWAMCNDGIFDVEVMPFGEMDEYVYNNRQTLKYLFYINYHMHMYNITTEKSEKKWRSIFGEENYNNLLLLNKADKGGH